MPRELSYRSFRGDVGDRRGTRTARSNFVPFGRHLVGSAGGRGATTTHISNSHSNFLLERIYTWKLFSKVVHREPSREPRRLCYVVVTSTHNLCSGSYQIRRRRSWRSYLSLFSIGWMPSPSLPTCGLRNSLDFRVVGRCRRLFFVVVTPMDIPRSHSFRTIPNNNNNNNTSC
jgi:hypothetical protein